MRPTKHIYIETDDQRSIDLRDRIERLLDRGVYMNALGRQAEVGHVAMQKCAHRRPGTVREETFQRVEHAVRINEIDLGINPRPVGTVATVDQYDADGHYMPPGLASDDPTVRRDAQHLIAYLEFLRQRKIARSTA